MKTSTLYFFAVLTLPVLAARPAHGVPGNAGAEQVEPPKSHYHLFRPVPRHRLRDLSADRPDGTESPNTVDAGHFQAELSFFDFTRDVAGFRTDTWNLADLNLKVGLLSQVDLHLGFAVYSIERTRQAGATSTTHGFGDLTLRLKVNLWGNDGGKTGLAILPWVTIPSYTKLSGKHPETGFVIPFGWAIIERVSMGSQLGVTAQWDEPQNRYSLSIEHTFVVGFSIYGPLSVFVEYLGVANAFPSDNPYLGAFSGGITVLIGKNIMLDAATQLGLTRAADDWKIFSGMTFRI
jgi:Putative MetA-pathway of phenol degradation